MPILICTSAIGEKFEVEIIAKKILNAGLPAFC